eukprot:1258339-Rhodomonas_salina.1
MGSFVPGAWFRASDVALGTTPGRAWRVLGLACSYYDQHPRTTTAVRSSRTSIVVLRIVTVLASSSSTVKIALRISWPWDPILRL